MFDIPVLHATSFPSCCFGREQVLRAYPIQGTYSVNMNGVAIIFQRLQAEAVVQSIPDTYPCHWRNKSIFMPHKQNRHLYLDSHHVHKVLWEICSLCMWGNGSENTDNFQNACSEFQCLLLVLANSELLLGHTKSLTPHVKYIDLLSVWRLQTPLPTPPFPKHQQWAIIFDFDIWRENANARKEVFRIRKKILSERPSKGNITTGYSKEKQEKNLRGRSSHYKWKCFWEQTKTKPHPNLLLLNRK